MALNIKNPETEQLAAEVARMTGETKTEAIRKALSERRERLAFNVVAPDRREQLQRLLERDVWPQLPKHAKPMSKKERERLLGYGADGV